MNLLDRKIDELKRLIYSFETDELTLRDIVSMDESFEDIVMTIRELKNDIVNSRFIRSLDE